MPPPDPRRGATRAITSLQNERVKLIRSLEMRKIRRETGLFVAEGASVLVTAREQAGCRDPGFLAGSAQAGIARALLVGAGHRRGTQVSRPTAKLAARTIRRPCWPVRALGQ
jgi:hypothetical protein